MRYLDSLVKIKDINTNEGEIVEVFELLPNIDDEGVAFSGDDISIVDKLPAALKWENIGGINYGYLYFVSKEDYSSADFFVPRMIEIKPLQRRPRERQRYFPSVDFAHGKMVEANDMAIACFLKIVPNDNAAIFCGRKDSANKMLSRIIELEQRGYDVSGLKERANLDEIIRISNLLEKHYGQESVLCKAAQLGVFVHHAGVSDGIKSAVAMNIICLNAMRNMKLNRILYVIR